MKINVIDHSLGAYDLVWHPLEPGHLIVRVF